MRANHIPFSCFYVSEIGMNAIDNLAPKSLDDKLPELMKIINFDISIKYNFDPFIYQLIF